MSEKPYTISTAEVWDMPGLERSDSPEPIDEELEKRLAHKLWHDLAHQKAMLHMHLKAVIDGNRGMCHGYCDWCDRQSNDEHSANCAWARAEAYFDSLNGETSNE